MTRHAWLFHAAKQIRRWREEDRSNGIIWADEQQPTRGMEVLAQQGTGEGQQPSSGE